MKEKDILKQFLDNENIKEPNKSGFFPLPQDEICNDREHDPPKYLHIPQGQGYKHVCPRCGKTQTVIPPQITL